MSNSESPPADGDYATPIKIPSESEDQLPSPDPLLGSGSFIDPNNGVGADHNAAKEPNQSASKETDPLLSKRDRPSWLPENWDMILKKRTSGVTEGTFDRYYISPSGQRLRSKNEVMTFIETGSKRKKTPTATSASDDAASEGGSAPRSKKKTSARKKVHAALTFDFKNPPEKVSWILSYATEDVWSPSIGDWNLPLATKQEWASVFNHVSQS